MNTDDLKNGTPADAKPVLAVVLPLNLIKCTKNKT